MWEAAASPLAVFLVTCGGRGQRLFGGAGHDTAIVRERLGEPPTAGFFAAGEFGPIAGVESHSRSGSGGNDPGAIDRQEMHVELGSSRNVPPSHFGHFFPPM